METMRQAAWGFSVRYGESRGGATEVYVRVGTEQAPGEDCQRVLIRDRRLPFEVDAYVEEGRLADLQFSARPGSRHSLEQKDLRTSGIVALVRAWAQLGREHQVRQSATGQQPVGMVELPDQEGATDLREAIASTRSALGAWLPPVNTTEKRRLRGREADELLKRVVGRYLELVEAGVSNPREVIGAEEGYHPAHIGRLLVKARKPDPKTGRPPLLGPARTGVAGERTEHHTRIEEMGF